MTPDDFTVRVLLIWIDDLGAELAALPGSSTGDAP